MRKVITRPLLALCLLALLPKAANAIQQNSGLIAASSAPGSFANVWPPSSSQSPSATSSSKEEVSRYNEATAGRDFVTRSSRQQFVRRVYSIFLTQSMATAAIVAAVANIPDLASFFSWNQGAISLLSFIGCCACLLTLTLSPTARFKKPTNFFLLGGYTLFQSLGIAAIATIFRPETFLLGAMHTLTALSTITLYSFQSNASLDLTTLGNSLLVSLSALTFGSLFGFLFKWPIVENIQAGLCAAIFAVYIAHDTQMIVGGKHRKHKFAENEYIMAALSLYQDVVGLFLQLLKLLSKADKEKQGQR